MASATITYKYDPVYVTMTGTNIDAGNNDITLSGSQCNFEKGFAIQTGTLTAMTVTILDSLDGSTFIDNTIDYLPVAAAASDKVYKCELNPCVKAIKIRAARTNAANAVDVKVLIPNR